MSNREPGVYWVKIKGVVKTAEYSKAYDEWYDVYDWHYDKDVTVLSETPIRPPVALRAEEMYRMLKAATLHMEDTENTREFREYVAKMSQEIEEELG